jgi:UDP-N-acetylglucosamine 4-epimerase
VINGDGSNSRDFTYIDNVIQMNHLAATTDNKDAIGQVFNTAVGDRTTLIELTNLLKKYLSEFDPKIADVEIVHGPNRKGDIPHSLASIEKGEKLLGYKPSHHLEKGLDETVKNFVIISF